MKFLVKIIPNTTLVDSIKKISSLSQEKLSTLLEGPNTLVVEDDECSDDEDADFICVVNISQNEQTNEYSADLSAFTSTQEAEDCFIKIASHKFSNWDDYSPEDIQAVLDDGYEQNGNSALCLVWAS